MGERDENSHSFMNNHTSFGFSCRMEEWYIVTFCFLPGLKIDCQMVNGLAAPDMFIAPGAFIFK